MLTALKRGGRDGVRFTTKRWLEERERERVTKKMGDEPRKPALKYPLQQKSI